MAVASLIIGIVALALSSPWLLVFPVFFVEDNVLGSITMMGAMLGFILSIPAFICAIVGTVLGFVGLKAATATDKQKRMATWGVLLNLLVFVPPVLFMLIGVAASF